jgi:hypothetical protein
MRVLLDECVPRALRNDLPGHEVKTVAELGWAGVKNGELLRRAAAEFDLLITVDRNLEYQQSFEGLSLAVIVVHASSNDVTILRPLMPAVAAVIDQTRPGAVTHVRQPVGWVERQRNPSSFAETRAIVGRIARPVEWVDAEPDHAMKRRIWPVADPAHMSMFHRIEMDIVG